MPPGPPAHAAMELLRQPVMRRSPPPPPSPPTVSRSADQLKTRLWQGTGRVSEMPVTAARP
jgi:hypothetical protein